MSTHALFGASVMQRRLACPASAAAEVNEPDTPSAYADEGTAAHEVLAWTLTAEDPQSVGWNAEQFVGREVLVNGNYWPVTAEMVQHVNVTVEAVAVLEQEMLNRGAVSVQVYSEVRVPIGQITGEEGAEGTADVVLIGLWPDDHAEVTVIDLKYGRGVEVSAEDNEQLRVYALGAMALYAPLGLDFTACDLVISQPRVSTRASMWRWSADEWQSFAEHVATVARYGQGLVALADSGGSIAPQDYVPGEKQCQFCRGKVSAVTGKTCPGVLATLQAHVVDFPGAEDVPAVAAMDELELSQAMALAPVIEAWVIAVRAQVERTLLAGQPVVGYKLVQGRQGNRAWADKEEAEKVLKSMRLTDKQMYDFSLISPTTAEKLAKDGTIGPRQWPRLKDSIVRADGKPSVAPAADKRPAIFVVPATAGFESADDSLA